MMKTNPTDDLHFTGAPTEVTGMEMPVQDKEGMLSPGSIFDEEDVMSQINYVLGFAAEDDEAPQDMMMEGMEEEPVYG